MPKHHKERKEGIGSDLIGIPDELIKLIVRNEKEKEWALDQVVNEGPGHKQVYSALLLKRVHVLVRSVAKQTGKAFVPQKGGIVISNKDKKEIPVPLVLKELNKKEQAAIMQIFSHSPAHESVAFNSLMQAIEWSISALNE
jgi:hypothetical protein